MRNFRKLRIWLESKILAVEIYSITKSLPSDEKFGLCSQMRRCSVSIPSNIAEGCGRRTPQSFAYFLDIAMGSAFELETQLSICGDLGYIDRDSLNAIFEKINKLQRGINSLRSKVMNDIGK